MTLRLDQFLVFSGFCKSRTQAADWIKQGRVFIRGNLVLKPSLHCVDVSPSDLSIAESVYPEFVSRGGIKLWEALNRTGLSISTHVALDVGQSTGGFTDCLLKKGVKKVVGIEVGVDQLASSLRGHPQVTTFEKTNFKDLRREDLLAKGETCCFDLIVCDVSFISLSFILPQIKFFLKPEGHFLGLVKPQFEVGPEHINRSGIVKDKGLYKSLQKNLINLCKDCDLRVEDYFESAITGRDGNTEFFIWCRLHKGVTEFV